jgi:hypothetical protein
MKQDNRDIDKLLKANVQDQLAHFNWDRFTTRVAGRLAANDLQSRSRWPGTRFFIAAAAVVLVGVVVTIVLTNSKTPSGDPTPMPGRATVVMAERATEKGVGRCEIRIHTSETPPENTEKRTSWCIVTVPEPLAEDVGYRRNLVNLACLF